MSIKHRRRLELMRAVGIALMCMPVLTIFAFLLIAGFWKLASVITACVIFWLVFFAGLTLVDKSRR